MSDEPGVYIINQNPGLEHRNIGIKNIEKAQKKVQVDADEVYQIISNRNLRDSTQSLRLS